MCTGMSLPGLALLAALVGGQAGRSEGARADEGKRNTSGARAGGVRRRVGVAIRRRPSRWRPGDHRTRGWRLAGVEAAAP